MTGEPTETTSVPMLYVPHIKAGATVRLRAPGLEDRPCLVIDREGAHSAWFSVMDLDGKVTEHVSLFELLFDEAVKSGTAD